MKVHQNEMLFRKAIKRKRPRQRKCIQALEFLCRVTGSTNGSKFLAKIIINKQIILKKSERDNAGELALHRGQP